MTLVITISVFADTEHPEGLWALLVQLESDPSTRMYLPRRHTSDPQAAASAADLRGMLQVAPRLLWRLSRQAQRADREYAALRAESGNGGMLGQPQVDALRAIEDAPLRNGVTALAVAGALQRLDERWQSQLNHPSMPHDTFIDYNPVIGLALDLDALGLPESTTARLQSIVRGDQSADAARAALEAKAQVLQQIGQFDAAWQAEQAGDRHSQRFAQRAAELLQRTLARFDGRSSDDHSRQVPPRVRAQCCAVLEAAAARWRAAAGIGGTGAP
jgi:hypothetical protein